MINIGRHSILFFVFTTQICLVQESNKETAAMQTERYNRGWEKLKEIDGEAGEKVIQSLKDISPDLGRFYYRVRIWRCV
ncbi:hypothetical protein [Sphingobacterium hungaricum]